MQKWVYLLLVLVSGCAEGQVLTQEGDPVTSITCRAQVVQYPITAESWRNTYRGREFYADGNHLGRDIALPEGTAIHPIACGTIQVFRPANGYGTLVVVIEHQLSRPVNIINGSGETVAVTSFLSIYGHLRATSLRRGGQRLNWRTGDTITSADTIGYVQNDEENGDGAEHLHLGIRLQSAVDAIRTDPRAWFRGYDTVPSQRSNFADPQGFLAILDSMRGQLEGEDGLGREPAMAAPDASSPSFDATPSSMPTSAPSSTPSSMPTSPPMMSVAPPATTTGIRYEFRVMGSGWNPQEPYRLRDQAWQSQLCQNNGTTNMQPLYDGWYRCDVASRVSPFVGSFFDPNHLDWGDHGHIATVGNAPERCTFTNGVSWRITDLATGRRLFDDEGVRLPCVSVGSQDRHRLP